MATTAIPTADAGLPLAVCRHLDRALPARVDAPAAARITQEGVMWSKPGGRAMRFEAVQTFTLHETAFEWRARFPMLPLVTLRIVDGFRSGKGRMDGTVLGIPFMRKRGPEIALGAAMRYLAELPMWAPHAALANPGLEWRELDTGAIEVATSVRDRRASVELEFDAGGDLVGCFAPDRPYGDRGPTPWRGRCGDYAVLSGVRVPTSATVAWELPDGPFTYFECHLRSLELLGRDPTAE